MVEDAKTKMTELVLDKLMEDTSRNPTLSGDLSTRNLKRAQAKRNARRRGSAGSGMAAALGLGGSNGLLDSSAMLLTGGGGSVATSTSQLSGVPSPAALKAAWSELSALTCQPVCRPTV